MDTKPDTESKYESDTSGSTKAVNSKTKLKDGVYKPDKFSWSGGSGRVNITCCLLYTSSLYCDRTVILDIKYTILCMSIAISVIDSVRISCRIEGFSYVRNLDKQVSSTVQPASVGTSRRDRNTNSLLICRYLEGKCGLVIFLCSLCLLYTSPYQL